MQETLGNGNFISLITRLNGEQTFQEDMQDFLWYGYGLDMDKERRLAMVDNVILFVCLSFRSLLLSVYKFHIGQP